MTFWLGEERKKNRHAALLKTVTVAAWRGVFCSLLYSVAPLSITSTSCLLPSLLPVACLLPCLCSLSHAHDTFFSLSLGKRNLFYTASMCCACLFYSYNFSYFYIYEGRRSFMLCLFSPASSALLSNSLCGIGSETQALRHDICQKAQLWQTKSSSIIKKHVACMLSLSILYSYFMAGLSVLDKPSDKTWHAYMK